MARPAKKIVGDCGFAQNGMDRIRTTGTIHVNNDGDMVAVDCIPDGNPPTTIWFELPVNDVDSFCRQLQNAKKSTNQEAENGDVD